MDSTEQIHRQAFLLTWNQNEYHIWADPKSRDYIGKDIQELKAKHRVIKNWRCGAHKMVRYNDRIFLMKLGSQPKGIIGSGRVISTEAFQTQHWSNNNDIWQVTIEFDTLLNPAESSILALEEIATIQNQYWTPESSGISINPEIVPMLEKKWSDFLLESHGITLPVNVKTDWAQSYLEGGEYEVTLKGQERNRKAREKCLEIHGYKCIVCNFDFHEVYGKLGFGYIHVHHLTLFSSSKEERHVSPETDLVPVCPNCHAMLHKCNPPLTVDELKAEIDKAVQSN